MSEQNLQLRAKRYALIIRLLYANQGLSGKLAQVHRGARHLSYGVRLSDPMQLDRALKLAEPMALSAGTKAVMASRANGLVSYEIQLPQVYWQFYTRADVVGLEVGLAEQRRPVEFDFEPPHALIAGTTGAGKSETLKSILVALVTSYTPDELGLILVDPHRELDDFTNEAHLTLPIATTTEEIQNALAYANRELSHRKEENLKDGRLLVVAIDEAAADEVLRNQDNLQVLKNLSKQARKYRLHLILGTQKPSHGELPSVLDNLLNKWVGQLSDAGTSARVTGHAGLMAHKLTPKGDFLHITGPEVDRLQVAMATPADFDRLERCEVRPVIVEPADVVDLPASLPETGPGRPPVDLNAKTLAAYFYYGPPSITYELAERLFGQKRTGHLLHRDFCNEFAKEYLKLRRAGAKLIGA